LNWHLSAELLVQLREAAETEAIKIFARNLHELLLAAPAGPKAVLGIDPGMRTGCKMAVVDATASCWRQRPSIRISRETIGKARCRRWSVWWCGMGSNGSQSATAPPAVKRTSWLSKCLSWCRRRGRTNP
jgi:hypothetical protein